MNISPKNINLSQIASYLIKGTKLAFSKEIRPYIFIPILANVVLIFTSVIIFYFVISSYLDSYLGGFGIGILSFLGGVLAVIISFLLFFLMIYFFSTLAIIIASPFYGFLAQRIEEMESGVTPADEPLSAIFTDVPRILKREVHKQLFFIPRAIICFIISFIPILNFIAPLCWLYLTSFMASIQFTDYGFDNNKIPFKDMKKALNENKICTLFLGLLFVFGVSVPILNLIFPVIAVCAATLYFIDMRKYVEHYNKDQIENN